MTLKQQMLRIRMVEEEIARRYPEGQIRCPIHLSIGQEAQAVGVCAALGIKDQMVSTHRSHAHYLAKGGNLKAMIAELYGRDYGCSKGNGGSMHLIDESVGFMGSTSIVGGTIPIGVGLAFANKLRSKDQVVAIMLGDAATEEGVFHEAANFASLHRLKVVFVIEDNQYSCFTHISQRRYSSKKHSSLSSLTLGQMYAMNFWNVDSQDPEIIKDRMKWAIEHSPSILLLETWRHLQHCGPDQDDDLGYRDPKEKALWESKDFFKTFSIDQNIEECLSAEIKEAFDYART